MTRFTHLGREFHPRYATHRWVIGIALAAGLWGGWLAAAQGAGILAAGWPAVANAVAAFLAWAIGRELDPDHNLSALMASVATAAAQPWLGLANLLGLAWFLGLARIVNGSTGLPPRTSDLLLHYGAAAAVGWLSGPLLPAISGLAVVLAVVTHSRPRWQLGVGLLHVMTAALLALIVGWRVQSPPPLVAALGAGAAAAGIVWAARQREEVSSTGDYSREPLTASAIHAAIGLAALVLWIEWIAAPGMTITGWLPLLAALLSAALFQMIAARASRHAGERDG